MANSHILILAILLMAARNGKALDAVPLKPSDLYRVETTETVRGHLDLPDEKGKPQRLPIDGLRTVRYRERILPPTPKSRDGIPDRVLRVYDLIESRRTLKDQKQVEFPVRDSVRRIVLHRLEDIEKPYSPDGPLQWTEVETISHHVFAPALNGLLPAGSLQQGARWDAVRLAVAELSELRPLEDGSFTCEYKGTAPFRGKQLGQIAFTGKAVGISPEGRARDRVEGALYLDAASGKLHSVNVAAERAIVDKDGKKVGELKVEYQLALRPIEGADPQLGDDIVAALPLEPTAEQTALFYQHTPLGIELTHPRRWFLSHAEGPQLRFEYRGHVLILHFDPDGKTPSAKDYFAEVRGDLEKRKIPLDQVLLEPIEKERSGNRIGKFSVAAKMDGTPMMLDYYVMQRGSRGARLAAWFKSDLLADENVAKDAEAIIRGIVFTRPTLVAEKAK